MRIDDRTRKVIIDSVKAVFSPDTEVWLFGSRCDDNVKGGDIDLYIETPELDAPVARRINLKVLLSDQLEEQKIDVIVHNRNRSLPPIHQIAKSGMAYLSITSDRGSLTRMFI